MKSDRQPPEFYVNMWETIHSGNVWRGEFSNRRKNKEEFWESASISAVMDADGNPISYLAVKEDITDRKRKEDQIHYLALHDNLTGLYNRASFQNHLSELIDKTRRSADTFVLLFMDLDGFKEINDKYGHQAGDLILQKVTADILKSARSTDIVARLGGDEFGVILPNTSALKASRKSIQTVLDRIISNISRPMTFNDEICNIGVSIGVAEFPADADNIDSLIQNADKAMYTAKNHGTNLYSFYQTE